MLKEKNTSPMRNTLALIPHTKMRNNDQSNKLQAVVLAATMYSMIRQGVGRIVVVTHHSLWTHALLNIWPICHALLKK